MALSGMCCRKSGTYMQEERKIENRLARATNIRKSGKIWQKNEGK